MEVLKFDIVILGSGLAGMRAALQAAKAKPGVRIALVTKLHAMRSHSVSAEGGISGVLYPEKENDSIALHAYDTVKGSDYLSDQDAVEVLVNGAPEEIKLFNHLGVPWNVDEKGDLVLKTFGGMSVKRTAFAADKTGFFMLNALYDNLLSFDNVKIFHEHFATKLFTSESGFRALSAVDLASGELKVFLAKACIIATGGFGRTYGFTTTAYSSTGDGIALAYQAGLQLKNMEFVQFHPTALVPSGILITETVRGEGGYLLNSKGDRFMKKYAKSKMELAPRDIVSRSIMTEIEGGRGIKEKKLGTHEFVYLDMRHFGEEKIDEKFPMIKEIAMKMVGIDPLKEPLPVRPAAHFTMGGIHTDIKGNALIGRKRVAGLFAAGECGCVSVHGANRLGSNSLSQCVIWGRITGNEAARVIQKRRVEMSEGLRRQLNAEETRINSMFGREGKENPYDIREELWHTMDVDVGVYRTRKALMNAKKKIDALHKRYQDVYVKDKSKTYNTNLRDTLEIGNMLDLASVVIEGAINRKETRGAHARTDYPKRDDKNWLKHTLAQNVNGEIKLSYIPVKITKWKPEERKY